MLLRRKTDLLLKTVWHKPEHYTLTCPGPLSGIACSPAALTVQGQGLQSI